MFEFTFTVTCMNDWLFISADLKKKFKQAVTNT